MTRLAPFVDDPARCGAVFALLLESLGDHAEQDGEFTKEEVMLVDRTAAACAAAMGRPVPLDLREDGMAAVLQPYLAWWHGPEVNAEDAVASLLRVLQTIRAHWVPAEVPQLEFVESVLALFQADGRMTKAEITMVPLVCGTLGVPPEVVRQAAARAAGHPG